jgi:hypothetical protein
MLPPHHAPPMRRGAFLSEVGVLRTLAHHIARNLEHSARSVRAAGTGILVTAAEVSPDIDLGALGVSRHEAQRELLEAAIAATAAVSQVLEELSMESLRRWEAHYQMDEPAAAAAFRRAGISPGAHTH